jgi:hypothetical protein
MKPFSSSGNFSGSAGSAGISITLRTAQIVVRQRKHSHYSFWDTDLSSKELTAPHGDKPVAELSIYLLHERMKLQLSKEYRLAQTL